MTVFKSNKIQSILFILGSLIAGIISANAVNNPNNPATWAAFGLAAFQVVLNALQSIARLFNGQPIGQTLLNLYGLLNQATPALETVARHLPDLLKIVEESKAAIASNSGSGTGTGTGTIKTETEAAVLVVTPAPGSTTNNTNKTSTVDPGSVAAIVGTSSSSSSSSNSAPITALVDQAVKTVANLPIASLTTTPSILATDPVNSSNDLVETNSVGIIPNLPTPNPDQDLTKSVSVIRSEKGV